MQISSYTSAKYHSRNATNMPHIFDGNIFFELGDEIEGRWSETIFKAGKDLLEASENYLDRDTKLLF